MKTGVYLAPMRPRDRKSLRSLFDETSPLSSGVKQRGTYCEEFFESHLDISRTMNSEQCTSEGIDGLRQTVHVVSVTYTSTQPRMSLSIFTTAGYNRFKSIQQSKLNRIPVKFDLSGGLQSRCQWCVRASNETNANHSIL